MAVFFRAVKVRGGHGMMYAERRTEPAMKQFVRDHGLVSKSVSDTVDEAGNPVCSHYMYGGLYSMGKLTVPQGDPTRRLAEAVVADFRGHMFGALTENKPPGFMRFYMDVDVEMAGVPEEALWDRLQDVIIQEIQRFFPEVPPSDALYEAVVLASGYRAVELKTGHPGYKAGIHVVFQNLFVDVEQALYMTSAIIARAEREWPEEDGVWASRIDQAVYGNTRGLRWAWQLKAMVCPHCAKDGPCGRPIRNGRGCDRCDHGMAPDTNSSMYAPVYYVDGLGARTVLPECREDPTVQLLLDSSIRYIAVTEASRGWTLYPGAPPRPLLKRKGNNQYEIKSMDKPLTGGDLVAAHDPCYLALASAIRRCNPAYKDTAVKMVRRGTSGTWYRVAVKGAGARYCMNYGKDHRTASIKFYATPRGIQQECNCKCATLEGRKAGVPCKMYHSDNFLLTDQEKRVLFGTPDVDMSSGMLQLAMAPVVRVPSTPEEASVLTASQLRDRVATTIQPPATACLSHEQRQQNLSLSFIQRLQKRRRVVIE